MKLNLTKEELELMPYDDITYLLLKKKNKKMKVTDIFKEICELLELTENDYNNQIADFFTLIATEKRFIQLEKGYVDLREKHSSKISLKNVDDDGEEEVIEEEAKIEENEIDDGYYDDSQDSEDEEVDDDYKDLVIVDEEVEGETSL